MDTVALLQNGGVQVTMITGNTEEMALSVASRSGYMAQWVQELVQCAWHSCVCTLLSLLFHWTIHIFIEIDQSVL